MTYVIDDFGRKIKETDANAKVASFTYDINNNVTQVTDAKAQITTLAWSYGHLMASRTNLAAGNVNLTYNNLGQPSQVLVKAPASTTINQIQYDYTYDGFNRLNTLKDTRNAVVVDTLDYDFSPGGLLNKVKDGKGNETNYLYDAVGRLSGIWAPNYGTISYRYDAGGRLKEKWLPNGVNTRYAYFTDSTLAQVVNRATGASIITQHDYLYDAYANRRQHIEKIGATSLTFGYMSIIMSTLEKRGKYWRVKIRC